MRRVIHRIKAEIDDEDLIQIHDGITYTPYSCIYWCGKVERFIREEPQILTPLEQAEHNLFIEKQKIKPWPECMKCRNAKFKGARP